VILQAIVIRREHITALNIGFPFVKEHVLEWDGMGRFGLIKHPCTVEEPGGRGQSWPLKFLREPLSGLDLSTDLRFTELLASAGLWKTKRLASWESGHGIIL
jgi:hypothetical protein